MRRMLRSAWVGFVVIVATLLCAPTVILIVALAPDSRLVDIPIRLWARMIVAAAGIALGTEHDEIVRTDRRAAVLVANHHSYLDIPCLIAAVPQPVRFMAKASLFKIPLFGWSLRAAGFIPIDRKNRRTAVRSFELAGQRIRRGNTIVIFPEESRSRQWKMLPFQRGAFLLAIRSELPIIPVAIHGTYQVLPATRLIVRPGPVTIRFGHPFETAGMTVRAKEELMTRARQVIEEMLYGDEKPDDD